MNLFESVGAVTFDHRLKLLKTLLDHQASTGMKSQEHQLGMAQKQMDHQLSVNDKLMASAQKAAVLKAKAKEAGASFDPDSVGVPAMGGPVPMGSPTNPEAGPNDTVPAMLAPGEAVIPAEAAQDPQNKPLIEGMVQQGRQMQGYQAGITEVPVPGEMDPMWVGKPSTSELSRNPYETGRGRLVDSTAQVPPPAALPSINDPVPYQGDLGGLISDDREKRRLGVMRKESSGNPNAKNPSSTATGLYQITDGAWSDIQKRFPGIKDRNQRDAWYAYRQILSEQLGHSGSEDDLDRAWVTGAGGLKKIREAAKARPDALIEEVLPSAVFNKDGKVINPNLHKRSVTDFLAGDPYARGNSLYGREASSSRVAAGMPPKPAAPDAVPEMPAVALTPDALEGDEAAREAAVSTLSPEGQAKAQALEASAQDPSTQAALDALIQQVQAQPPESQKDWLGRAIASVWGEKTSLFQEQDLARFGVLMAGSLLTGGSIRGSLRYAGLNALQQADSRQAATAQAQAEHRKAVASGLIRAQDRQLALDKENRAAGRSQQAAIDADAREWNRKLVENWDLLGPDGQKYFQEGVAENPANRTAIIQSLLANKAGAIRAGKQAPKDPKLPQAAHMVVAPDGRHVMAYRDQNGAATLTKDQNGDFVSNPGMATMLSVDEYSALSRELETNTAKKVGGRVQALNKGFKPGSPEWIDKDALADSAGLVAKELFQSGRLPVSRESYRVASEMMDSVVQGMSPREAREMAMNPTLFKRAVEGMIVYQSDIASKALYRHTSGNGGKAEPSPMALALYGAAVENEAKAQGRSFRETAVGLESKWQAFLKSKDPDDKKRLREIEAKALVSRSDIGPMSPFLYWATQQIDVSQMKVEEEQSANTRRPTQQLGRAARQQAAINQAAQSTGEGAPASWGELFNR